MIVRKAAFIALALVIASALVSSPQLRSTIKTEQSYRSPNIPPNNIYSIQVKRVQSSKAEQVSRCWSVPRSMKVTRREELFRLSKVGAESRSDKVYEKLTSLSQQENIIQEFQIVGDKLFVVTTDGSGYFMQLSNPQEVHRMQTNLHNNATSNSLQFIVLKQYKERVLIITSNTILLCKFQKDQCEPVSGYKTIKHLRAAELFEENGRYLLFIISADALLSYELTANGELKNQQAYDSSFFGATKMSFRSLVRGEGSSFYVLDDIKGIWQIEGKEGLFKGFIPHQKIVFEQFGCYQMISDNQAQSLILACNPSLNNFFLMNLARSTQYTQAAYEPLETIFLQQQIYQISSVENILMGRVYSGVKLFWSSKQIGNPYPYFYRKAGDVFLHNAIQSKLKIINQTKTIFLAAEDELLKFQFRSVDPFVSCYSPVEVNEEYKLVYEVECREQSTFLGKENVCTKEEYLTFESWEHKEVRVGSDILPFVISFAGVIVVGYVIRKIYKQYNNEVDEARRKYNIQSDQLSL